MSKCLKCPRIYAGRGGARLNVAIWHEDEEEVRMLWKTKRKKRKTAWVVCSLTENAKHTKNRLTDTDTREGQKGQGLWCLCCDLLPFNPPVWPELERGQGHPLPLAGELWRECVELDANWSHESPSKTSGQSRSVSGGFGWVCKSLLKTLRLGKFYLALDSFRGSTHSEWNASRMTEFRSTKWIIFKR